MKSINFLSCSCVKLKAKEVQLDQWLTIIIFKHSRNEADIQSINLLLKEFLILVLELLENIIVVKKFLYRAVGLV